MFFHSDLLQSRWECFASAPCQGHRSTKRSQRTYSGNCPLPRPQAYISPSCYPSKAEHGKVVPTWNYTIVQVFGTPKIIENSNWLCRQLNDLTNDHEGRRGEPWRVEDAPADFVDAQMKGIVGLEIPIDRIEGEWKVGQNQPAPNRLGVINGLLNEGRCALAGELSAKMG